MSCLHFRVEIRRASEALQQSHQQITACRASWEAPQSSIFNPGNCSPHSLLNIRFASWCQVRLVCVSYRVILQGVDPWPASHITFFSPPARLAGNPHLFWQVPAQRRDFSTKAPLVSTRKTPQRHKHNVDLSRLPRKVDKPAKAFLGSS
jgi:hypothetical protein